jgi:Protein of unknown function (DUF2510)
VDVFEKQREKHQRAQQQKAEVAQRAAQEQAAAAWQEQHDAYQHVLELARDFNGEQSSDVVLKKDEALFGKLDGASLIEDRAGKGEWQGRSQGVSIPVGSLGGRSVRYRVGASRGHYVQGAPVATAIDTGTIFITNRRVIFRGHKQNRECVFDKLISCEHLDSGESVFAVSNRQKNTVLHYGPGLNDWFRIRYEVAFADYQGTRDKLVADVEAHLAQLDRSQPAPAPIVAAPELIPPPGPTMQGHPAEWATDPTGRHEYRYWDGNSWTDHVSDGGVTTTDPRD